MAGVAAALAALQRRGDELRPSAGLALDASPVVVFVPGHGQPHGSSAFAELVERMDLDDDSVRHFDYRWADGGSDPSQASESVPIDDAVSSLNSYVAGVAGDGSQVYLIGFSKGGATVAELVADWDDGGWGPSQAVVGAALLDPPIARGAHGWLQSVGRFWGPLPDDGGYDPVRCGFLRFSCSDRRDGLGRVSGVEVVVIRNPRAGITSFWDEPEDLRVYDAAGEGPTLWDQVGRKVVGMPGRVAKAHEGVLHDRRVADCLVAELRSGRCDLPRVNRRPPLPGLLGVAGSSPGQKIL